MRPIMTEIHPVGSSVTAATLREFARQSAGHAGGAEATTASEDRVEISDLASLLSRLAELPESRARKIVEVRNAIADGTYETPEKMNVAMEQLLKELTVEA